MIEWKSSSDRFVDCTSNIRRCFIQTAFVLKRKPGEPQCDLGMWNAANWYGAREFDSQHLYFGQRRLSRPIPNRWNPRLQRSSSIPWNSIVSTTSPSREYPKNKPNQIWCHHSDLSGNSVSVVRIRKKEWFSLGLTWSWWYQKMYSGGSWLMMHVRLTWLPTSTCTSGPPKITALGTVR